MLAELKCEPRVQANAIGVAVKALWDARVLEDYVTNGVHHPKVGVKGRAARIGDVGFAASTSIR